MLNTVIDWVKRWVRRHPILTGIWVLFLALCIVSLFTYPDGQRPNYLMGGFVLPAIALLTVVYMGRTIDRFRALRDYTRNRPPRPGDRGVDDPDGI
ncbi:MAG: hypothetical protein ACTHMX_11215 [Thermomicrobiales bacterium]